MKITAVYKTGIMVLKRHSRLEKKIISCAFILHFLLFSKRTSIYSFSSLKKKKKIQIYILYAYDTIAAKFSMFNKGHFTNVA